MTLASWRDDDTWEVVSLTVKKFCEGNEKKRGARGEVPIWQAVHASSGHELSLAQRTDKGMLLSMYEQGSQISGIR